MTITAALREIYEWTEAWAPIIPIVAALRMKPERKPVVKPVPIYFFAALFLNIMIDLTWKFKYSFPEWIQNNNVFYNVQSILRAAIFLVFYHRSLPSWYQKIIRVLAVLYVLVIIVDYSFFENIRDFSSMASTTEAITLLLCCLVYLFYLLSDDTHSSLSKNPRFWITLGLLLYVTANFAIFLVYKVLMTASEDFAVAIWDIHNAFYLLLCVLSAKAFHQRYQLTN